MIFRRAIRRDQVAVDPTEHLELRRPKGQRERIASPAEARELLAALGDAERVLWASAFYTGLRRGELRALRWEDVDQQARVIHVTRGWADVHGEQETKSDAGRRDVPILDLLAPELVALRLRSGRTTGLVFGLDAETPFYPSTVRNRALKAWKTANEQRAGDANRASTDPDITLLDPIGLHESRHTCASVLIASGANPKVIQRIMGHATIQMTFDQYGRLMPDGLEEAAKRANAYLAEALRRTPTPRIGRDAHDRSRVLRHHPSCASVCRITRVCVGAATAIDSVVRAHSAGQSWASRPPDSAGSQRHSRRHTSA